MLTPTHISFNPFITECACVLFLLWKPNKISPTHRYYPLTFYQPKTFFFSSNNYDISRNSFVVFLCVSFHANIDSFLFHFKTFDRCVFCVNEKKKQTANIWVSLKIGKPSVGHARFQRTVLFFENPSRIDIFPFLTFSLNECNFYGTCSRIFKYQF